MDRTRISLDDPAFAGRFRQTGRSPGYAQRPIQHSHQLIPEVSPEVGAMPELNEAELSDAIQHLQAAKQEHLLPREQLEIPAPASQLQLPKHNHQQSHVPQKSEVLRRDIVPVPIIPVRHPKEFLPGPEYAKKPKRPMVLYAMAATVFLVGVLVSLNGFRANRQVAAQVKAISSKSDSGDSSDTPPSTVKPTAAAVGSYAVAPNLPRYIDITKLGVHARVLSMGVTSQNRLQAPGNVYDAGWYNSSAQPGQPGGMLIDGHISSWTTQGVFYGLKQLAAGDIITITRGDGKTFDYKVVRTLIEDSDAVDMASLLVSQDTAKPGLNLISCSGDVIPGTNEFDKRIIVNAVME